MGKRSKARRHAAAPAAVPATPDPVPAPAPVSVADPAPAPEPPAPPVSSAPAETDLPSNPAESTPRPDPRRDEPAPDHAFHSEPEETPEPETFVLKGGIQSTGPVRILSGARVTGSVVAREVVVGGTVEGDATAQESVVLQSGGHVAGSLTGSALQIEEGARFTGRVRIGFEPAPGRPGPSAAEPGAEAAESGTPAKRGGRNWWFKEETRQP